MPHGIHTPIDANHLCYGVHSEVPFSLDAGKGKCCMWLVTKVEIYFFKNRFMDGKWSNLNAPRSYTPWCRSILGPIVGCPFHCMQENGNAACGWLIKWNFIFLKYVSRMARNPTSPQDLTNSNTTTKCWMRSGWWVAMAIYPPSYGRTWPTAASQGRRPAAAALPWALLCCPSLLSQSYRATSDSSASTLSVTHCYSLYCFCFDTPAVSPNQRSQNTCSCTVASTGPEALRSYSWPSLTQTGWLV